MPRVIAHAHSTWSHDGVLRLDEWPDLARAQGCSAVLLSEHEESGWTASRYKEYVQACRRYSTGDLQLVPGIEFNQDGIHVLCYGLTEYPPRPSTAEQLRQAVQVERRFLCLAHPGKYGWAFSSELLAAVDAVEIWNSKWIYDGLYGPHPRSWQLATGKLPLVGQDIHKRKHVTSLFVNTASSHVLDDIAAGRYTISCDGQQWTCTQLRSRKVAGMAQRCRTQLLRKALRAYRWTRPLRQHLGILPTNRS